MSSFIFLLNEKKMPEITGSTCPGSVAHWSFCLWLHLVSCTHMLIVALGPCFMATLGHAFILFYFLTCQTWSDSVLLPFQPGPESHPSQFVLLNLQTYHHRKPASHKGKDNGRLPHYFVLGSNENFLLTLKAYGLDVLKAWFVNPDVEDQWLRGVVVLKWMPFAGSRASRAGGTALGEMVDPFGGGP